MTTADAPLLAAVFVVGLGAAVILNPLLAGSLSSSRADGSSLRA